MTTIGRFDLIEAGQALLPIPAVDWLIDGIISSDTLSCFFGEPGSKKTWSLMHLAACVAAGLPWLGYDVKQAPVLWIDEESGKNRYLRRLNAIMGGLGITQDIPLYGIAMQSFDAYNLDDIGALQDIINATGARLVIIDALVDVMLGHNENDAAHVQPVVAALRHQVADKFDAAVVLIHHAGKNGNYRGSSALKGAVDNLIEVKSANGPDIEYTFEKARDADPITWGAQAIWTPATFALIPVQVQSKPATATFSKSQTHVLTYLRDKGRSLMTAICNAAAICSPQAARQAVYNLAKLGLCERVDNGGNGQAAEYDLTPQGRVEAANL